VGARETRRRRSGARVRSLSWHPLSFVCAEPRLDLRSRQIFRFAPRRNPTLDHVLVYIVLAGNASASSTPFSSVHPAFQLPITEG
jgi:hypothetical protein